MFINFPKEKNITVVRTIPPQTEMKKMTSLPPQIKINTVEVLFINHQNENGL